MRSIVSEAYSDGSKITFRHFPETFKHLLKMFRHFGKTFKHFWKMFGHFQKIFRHFSGMFRHVGCCIKSVKFKKCHACQQAGIPIIPSLEVIACPTGWPLAIIIQRDDFIRSVRVVNKDTKKHADIHYWNISMLEITG
jgi:hypothetical protein